MHDKRTKRMLNTVGKKTFVACFEARQKWHDNLSTKKVHELCWPDSRDWEEGSLATKTSSVNQIFRENRHCGALEICCHAKRISSETRLKAQSLYAECCANVEPAVDSSDPEDNPADDSPNESDKLPRYVVNITIEVFENK